MATSIGDRDTRAASPVLVWAGVVLGVIVGIAGYLAWSSLSVTSASANDALRRFSEIRRTSSWTEPVIQIDEAGVVTRRVPPRPAATRPNRLLVLVYRADAERLVRADLPFWFVRMKGTAVGYALGETGLDLNTLGISPAELERYGPSLILDQARTNGDRVLVWTE